MKIILIASLTFLITAISFASHSSDSDSESPYEEPSFAEWARTEFDVNNFPDPFDLYPLSQMGITTPKEFAEYFENQTGMRILRYAYFNKKPWVIVDYSSN
jgi:hypothetical protein